MAFYMGCRPTLQDFPQLHFLEKIPQKINFARLLERIMSDLEEQLRTLSTILLDTTTGFLSLLCCKTVTESAMVMSNFRDNVYSMQEEYNGVMGRCGHKKLILRHMLEDSVKEGKLILLK